MKDEPWFSARCVFQHEMLRDAVDNGPNLLRDANAYLYEERIVLVLADSMSEALRKGGEWAKQYVEANDEVKALGFIEVFHLFDSVVSDGTEVFSLMRESNLDLAAYVDYFFDDGSERRTSEVPS